MVVIDRQAVVRTIRVKLASGEGRDLASQIDAFCRQNLFVLSIPDGVER